MARKILQKIIPAAIVLIVLISCKANQNKNHEYKSEFVPMVGDLLFQDIDCGPVCEAIETVTKGFKNADFSHIGIVDTLNGKLVVLEAISEGVVYTPLDDFLNRSTDSLGNPKVLAGRLKSDFSESIPNIMKKSRTYLGLGYDNVFILNDSVYYCSELVYEAYIQEDSNLFSLNPMTFKAVGSNEFFPEWVSYYKSLGVTIPEGEMGINPGLISLSPNINIVHVYGYPEGYKP